MIYGNTIYRRKMEQLLESPVAIMQEYYENELSLMEDTIMYQKKMHNAIITESSEVEYIHEGFIENAINKIKELLQKFIDWIKNIISSIKNFFKKDKGTGSVEDVKKTKEEIEKKKQEILALPEPRKPKETIKVAKEVGLITTEECKEALEKQEENKSSVLEVKRLKGKDCLDDILRIVKGESKLLNNAYLFVRSIPNSVRAKSERLSKERVSWKHDEIIEYKETLERYNDRGLVFPGPRQEKFKFDDYIETIKLETSNTNMLDKLYDEYKETAEAAKATIDTINKYSNEYLKQAETMKKSVDSVAKFSEAELLTDLHKVVNLYVKYAKTGISKYIRAATKVKKLSKKLNTELMQQENND